MRKQCKKCPWRKGVDPHTIPNGYSAEKHEALHKTLGHGIGDRLTMMACHETEVGAELPCVGWLVNQLGPGNNLALRLAVMLDKIDANVQIEGEQHERFEDTLPRSR